MIRFLMIMVFVMNGKNMWQQAINVQDGRSVKMKRTKEDMIKEFLKRYPDMEVNACRSISMKYIPHRYTDEIDMTLANISSGISILMKNSDILMFFPNSKVREEELISWNAFRDHENNITPEGDYIRTNIACPKCGKAIHKKARVLITTYPPKSEYRCFDCNWCGTA